MGILSLFKKSNEDFDHKKNALRHLPVPYIFVGTRGRSLPDILVTGSLVPNIYLKVKKDGIDTKR